MRSSVYVLGRDVAVLEPAGDFRSVLTYRADVASDDFVSVTMPIRTESYVWDDVLHPIFQMNLPEGYLLQVLQEQLGPQVTGSPMALLSVIGRNMVGRIQVAAPGANLAEPLQPIELAALLQGDNSEEALCGSRPPTCHERCLGNCSQVLGCPGRTVWHASEQNNPADPSSYHQRLHRQASLRFPERVPVYASCAAGNSHRENRGVCRW